MGQWRRKVTASNLDLTMRATGMSQGPLGSNAGIWTEGVNNGKLHGERFRLDDHSNGKSNRGRLRHGQ